MAKRAQRIAFQGKHLLCFQNSSDYALKNRGVTTGHTAVPVLLKIHEMSEVCTVIVLHKYVWI